MRSLTGKAILTTLMQINRCSIPVAKHPSEPTLFKFLKARLDIDQAIEQFYSHSAECLNILRWWIGQRIAFDFFGNELPILLPNTPIEKALWNNMLAYASNHVLEIVPGDNINDFIALQLLNCYDPPSGCGVEVGGVVLDIGAHVGGSAMYFSEKVGPEGAVYAFEPGMCFEKLTNNVKNHENIRPVQKAVWYQSGAISLYDTGNASSSVLNRPKAQERTVQTTTIDAFVAEQELDRIDYIKMNIEGGEWSALMGAGATLTRFRPKLALGCFCQFDEFIRLPRLICSLYPNYRFWLGQYKPTHYGLRLFCLPDCEQKNTSDAEALLKARDEDFFTEEELLDELSDFCLMLSKSARTAKKKK